MEGKEEEKYGHLTSTILGENGFGPGLPHCKGEYFSYGQGQEEVDGMNRMSGIME